VRAEGYAARVPGGQNDAERRVRAILIAAIAVLLSYVAFGDKPWDPDLAERVAAGKPLRAKDYAARYEWWASLINAGLAAGLLATRSRWLRPDRAPAAVALAPPEPPSRAQLGLVLLAMVVLGVTAGPRLGHGFWDDEATTARNAVAGFYEADREGRLRFHDASWRDTLWRYDPNNHVAFSVVGRLASAPWRLLGSADERVPEPALRLPAFAFGLAALPAAFLLLWRLGFAGAGVVAAWLLALHPWMVRYASEARGYSLEMLMTTGSVYLLIEALYRGRLRDWLGVGAAELVMLWTYPPAVIYVGLLNLAALAALHRLRGGTPELALQRARWLVGGLVAAMLVLQLALPNLVQLAAYLDEQHRPIDLRFVWSALSYFFAGEPWSWHRRAAPGFPELARQLAEHPVALPTAIAVTLLALALGVGRLLRAPSPRPALAPLLLLTAPLTVLLVWLRSDELYVWHLCYLLPPLACLVGLGLQAPAARLGPLALAIPVAYLAAFAWWTDDARTALRTRPLEPMRESVAVTRPLDPHAAGQREVITASFSDEPFYYDPFVERVGDVGELESLVRESDASGRPLYVNLGRIELAEKRRPELLTLVRRPELFDEVAVFEGFEPEHTRRVYLHAPRAAPERAQGAGER